MWSGLLLCLLAVSLAGCPGGDGALGARCSSNSACSGELQCFDGVCVPRCERAPECGDGFRCDTDGLCQPADGQVGDACTSEVECATGLSCQVDGSETDPETGYLGGSCVAENTGRPAGETCTEDADCRNGTCDLGHCVDLCSSTRDCAAGTSCTGIPRVVDGNLFYRGCLKDHGSLSWSVPVQGAADTVYLPVPESAQGLSVLFTVEDPNQKVGATEVVTWDMRQLIHPDLAGTYTYFTNPMVRHRPEYGQSVLAMPSTPTTPLEAGFYAIRVSSLREGIDMQGNATDVTGTATPSVTAVMKLDPGVILDLHFFFLDLDDHPCAQAFAGQLDAEAAQTAEFFQTSFLGQLRAIFARGGIALGAMTYQDLLDHPDLDGLELSSAPSLFSLGEYSTGINVFFVRSLSPVGVQAFGPGPGPAGLARTRSSGIVVGIDTLCYRSWPQLARIAAHELARYMGLYNNVEVDPTQPFMLHNDPIPDTDSASTNLMFYSELGGDELTDGQRYVLSRSPVLR